jgi:hypothetical protein
VVGVFAGNGIVVREWAGLGGSLADFGELRVAKRRDDSFPGNGTGVIGLASRCAWMAAYCAGNPDTLMIPPRF